eukprot:gene31639-38238_t
MTSVKQQQVNVSKTESLVLIKNMIRISVSSICYFRDIFPVDCYKNKQYGNVQIHQLQGAQKNEDGEIVVKHKDAFLLTQWLEKGVFSALEAEYLRSMVFAIYTKHPKTHADLLMESYEFKVSYAGPGRSAKLNDTELFSKDSVKNQAAKFIRQLTEFTSTLDELPVDRWLTVQLKYEPHAPDDYEPEFFGPAASSILSGLRLPLVINVGSIQTANLDMRVKFAGLESLLFDDLCKESQSICVNQREDVKETPRILLGKSHQVSVASEEGSRVDQKQQHSPAELEEDFDRMEVTDSPKSSSMKDKVKNFILKEKCPIISRCAVHLGLSVDNVRRAFQDLQADGFLTMKGRAYVINSSRNDARAVPPAIIALDEEKKQLIDTQTPAIIEDLDEFTPDATRLETALDTSFAPPPKVQVTIRKQESVPLVSSTSTVSVSRDVVKERDVSLHAYNVENASP